MTPEATIPLTWALSAFAALGGLGLGVFRWWVAGLESQNRALTAELRTMTALLTEMRTEQRVQAERIATLTAEVERLREREAA